jgi:hypothetical protein
MTFLFTPGATAQAVRWLKVAQTLANPRQLYELALKALFALQRAVLYEDLAEMFERNESMLSFLEGELHSAQSHRRVVRAYALGRMLRTYRKGAHAGRLSHLLEPVVPQGDAMLLVGVDAANDKVAALKLLAQAVRQQGHIKAVVLGYCALPLVLAPLCYGLAYIVSGVLISIEKNAPPEISEQLWTGFNGVARSLAHAVHEHGVGFLGGCALAVVLVVYTLPRWRGGSRIRFEGWPIYSLYRDFQASLLFSAMALLLKTGGTLKGSLEAIAQRSSRWMRWHIFRILVALDENPNNPSIAFGRGLVCRPIQARAATLLRTASTLSDVLIELGTQEQTRVLARVKASALGANVAVVGMLLCVTTVLAIASITVPGSFANLSQPSSVSAARQKKEYEAAQVRRYGVNHGLSPKATPGAVRP